MFLESLIQPLTVQWPLRKPNGDGARRVDSVEQPPTGNINWTSTVQQGGKTETKRLDAKVPTKRVREGFQQACAKFRLELRMTPIQFLNLEFNLH